MSRRKRLMRRRNVAKTGEATVFVYSECEGTRLFPALSAFCRDQAYDDGTVRETGTILLFTEDGRYKAWLHDRDGACSCFVSNTTLTGLLLAAEAALVDEGLDWRADREDGWRKKK
jgi:hypothetical protein